MGRWPTTPSCGRRGRTRGARPRRPRRAGAGAGPPSRGERRYHGLRHVTWVVRHVLDLARTESRSTTSARWWRRASSTMPCTTPRPPTTRSRAPGWRRGARRARVGRGGAPTSRRARPGDGGARSDHRGRPRASCSTPTSPCSAASRPPTRRTSPGCGPSTGTSPDDGWRIGRYRGPGTASRAAPVLYSTTTAHRARSRLAPAPTSAPNWPPCGPDAGGARQAGAPGPAGPVPGSVRGRGRVRQPRRRLRRAAATTMATSTWCSVRMFGPGAKAWVVLVDWKAMPGDWVTAPHGGDPRRRGGRRAGRADATPTSSRPGPARTRRRRCSKRASTARRSRRCAATCGCRRATPSSCRCARSASRSTRCTRPSTRG